MIIRFRLEKFEKALVFQVLDMRENLRQCSVFTAKNWISVGSCDTPALHAHVVFLRGMTRDADFLPVAMTFGSNEGRDTHYKDVIQALKEWAEHHSKEEKALPSSGEFVF